MIPIALWWAWRHERHERVARLLLVWIAAIVVFFSLSGTKEDLYILPIVPAEAALIGAMLAKGMESRRAGMDDWRHSRDVRGDRAQPRCGSLPRIGIRSTAPRLLERLRLPVALRGFVWLFRRRVFASVATLAASVTVVVWCVVLCTLPDFERYKPVRPFSEIIRARASIGAIVGSYRFRCRAWSSIFIGL